MPLVVAILMLVGLAFVRDRATLGVAAVVGAGLGTLVIVANGGPMAAGRPGQTAILALVFMGVFLIGAGLRWWQMRAGPLAPMPKGRLALILGGGAVGLLAALFSR